MNIVSGVVAFNAANSYSGDTNVSTATLEISSDNNLGATDGNVDLGNGEILTQGQRVHHQP